MEEIKKKNKKLKKIAVILFCIIVTVSVTSIFIYNYFKGDISVQPNIKVEEEQTRAMFNAKFTAFSGTQKGAAIKVLLTSVMASNSSNYNEHIITIEVKDESLADNNSIANFISEIETKNKYEVNMYDSDNDDYIDKIFIRTEGEEVTEEELKLEEIKQRREEELMIIEQEMEREELKERIILSVIILLVALVSLILIIKTVKILKGNDENKKHKVLLTLVIIESVIIGGFLLFMLISCIPINTGII